MPCVLVPCAGRGLLILSIVWTLSSELTQRSFLVWARRRVSAHSVRRSRREPRRGAGRPRGCSQLRFAAAVRSQKPWGLERRGPVEGFSLLGEVRARREGSIPRRAKEAKLSWEGRPAGFVYHCFLQIFIDNDHSVPTCVLLGSLTYFKMNGCLKIRFYLTST